jgi:hypothetical protein
MSHQYRCRWLGRGSPDSRAAEVHTARLSLEREVLFVQLLKDDLHPHALDNPFELDKPKSIKRHIETIFARIISFILFCLSVFIEQPRGNRWPEGASLILSVHRWVYRAQVLPCASLGTELTD